MRIAIIDLGTNTFNLLISESQENNRFSVLYKGRAVVKLGEGGFSNGSMAEAAYRRGLNALKGFQQTIRELETTRIIAFGTSGLRSLKNGVEFITEVKDSIGIDIQIISGDREAELIYKGVKLATPLPKTPSLILDIGGGSNELIIVENDQVQWKKSFDLGVSRLKERFNPSDPILPQEISPITSYLKVELSPLSEVIKQFKPTRLIGSSGTFETFADLLHHRLEGFSYQDEIHLSFPYDPLMKLLDELLHTDYDQRINMPGMLKMRADMIVMSTIFVLTILEISDIRQIELSGYSLKEGILAEELES